MTTIKPRGRPRVALSDAAYHAAYTAACEAFGVDPLVVDYARVPAHARGAIIIALTRLCNASQGEIARRLGVSRMAVSKTNRRARTRALENLDYGRKVLVVVDAVRDVVKPQP